MKAKWIHLCMAAYAQGPMWNLIGVFDALPVQPEGRLPTGIPGPNIPPGPHVVMVLEAHPNEVDSQTEVLELRLSTEGGEVLKSQAVRIGWLSLGPGQSLLAPLGVPVPGWPIPGAGVYRFQMLRARKPIDAGVDLYVMENLSERGHPAPLIPGPDTGFKLEYGHLAFNVRGDPSSLVIEQIVDFYPVRQIGSGVFNGFYVELISGGVREGTKRRHHLELLGPDGGVLRVFDEGTITFSRAGPAHPIGAYVFTKIHNMVLPGAGSYEIVSYIDDARVGSTTFPLIAAAESPPSGGQGTGGAGTSKSGRTSGTPKRREPGMPTPSTRRGEGEFGLAPPLRLRWGHLCTAASYDHGRFQIPQLMQLISFPENHSGPFTATGVLALMFDATATEPLHQTLIIEPVTLLTGESVGPGREFALTFQRLGEGYRLYGPAIIPVEGWPLPGPGDFAFRLRVGDAVLGSVGIRVIQMGGGLKRVRDILPPPTPLGAPPLELKWVHLLADFDFARFRTGSLLNIVDYLRIPKRDRNVALGGFTLAMLFEGEMVDGIRLEHEVRIRFVDGNGHSVFEGGDEVHRLEFQPLSENRLGRRDALDLPDDLRLTPGDYTFEIYLDGQHLGTRDLMVFRST